MGLTGFPMRFLRWPSGEPHFPVWMTVLSALILGGILAGFWIHVADEPDNEPLRIYLAALHEIRDDFPSRPWWQRVMTGELRYKRFEDEIIRIFERGRDTSDPLLNVQYAISLLEFGRSDEVFDVLAAVDDPDYGPTVEVLRWLVNPDAVSPDPDFITAVAWLVEENDSWWSRKLGSMLADAGMMGRAPDSKIPASLWRKSLWAATMDWSLLGIFGIVAWALRSHRHEQVYSGIASGFGVASSNAKLWTAFLLMNVVFFLASDAGYFVAFWLWEDPPYLAFSLVEALSRLAPAMLFVVWFFPSWKISLRAMGLELHWLRNPSMWLWVCIGLLITSLGNWVLWFAADWFGGVDPLDFVDVDLATGRWEVLFFQLFVAGVLAPVSEEVIFRGVLFRTWAKRYGHWAGAVLSSILFALIHFYSPFGLFSVFMSGMIFAWVTWRTGSLWPAMLIHAFGNLMATWFVWWFFSSVPS